MDSKISALDLPEEAALDTEVNSGNQTK